MSGVPSSLSVSDIPDGLLVHAKKDEHKVLILSMIVHNSIDFSL